MTTFQNSLGDEIDFVRSFENVLIDVTDRDDDCAVIVLPKSDAPAIALAVLEAAGVEAFQDDTDCESGTDNHLRRIAYELDLYGSIKRANEKLDAINKRRQEIYTELFGGRVNLHLDSKSPLGQAVDRIIKLENQVH